jgi:hypothetical protein
MFYTKLTMDQVAATYTLFRFLERLKIIGHLKAHTEQVVRDTVDIFGYYDMSGYTGREYSIVKDGYTADKGHIDAIVEFERAFGRIKAPQHRGTD